MSTEVDPGQIEAAFPEADHRHRPRKRGEALEQAIAAAVIAELSDRGYGALTFEGVAARAGTGKSALYRRWPDKASMTADAFAVTLPGAETLPLAGELRADLILFLDTVARGMLGAMGVGMRLLSAEIYRHVDFGEMWKERVIQPWHDLLVRIIDGAIERGEARTGATDPHCVIAVPSVLCQGFTMTGVPMSHDEITALVDNALLPMLAARN
ncbi:TetR/AcrR family transcriptional regulator [Streptomyces sp. SID3343]|uniref:TetR/AcrR family transcriptional regulator C-terminal ligand-binding domain-containing protein n=1 Tax=Streptomyces sp. SID3343 TaxID=2690260 RepID=UPI0019275C6E